MDKAQEQPRVAREESESILINGKPWTLRTVVFEGHPKAKQ